MSDNTPSETVTEADIDKTAKLGWNRFTRFLLINVVLSALALMFVAALTVWS